MRNRGKRQEEGRQLLWLRRWQARICHKGRRVNIGYFTSDKDAAAAYEQVSEHAGM
jgi:hypothetical protein